MSREEQEKILSDLESLNKEAREVNERMEKTFSMKGNFLIDFFELCFLAEACIPPAPIARTTFWLNLINKYYHELSKEQRGKLFEWMNRSSGFNLEEEYCKLFNARFDSANQYSVTVKEKDHPPVIAFKWNDRYYVSDSTYVEPSMIKEVALIEKN
jgi:hypothetical protein